MAELKTWFRRCAGCGEDVLVTDPKINHGEPMCDNCQRVFDTIPDEICKDCGKNHRADAIKMIAENRALMSQSEEDELDMDELWAKAVERVDQSDLEY